MKKIVCLNFLIYLLATSSLVAEATTVTSTFEKQPPKASTLAGNFDNGVSYVIASPTNCIRGPLLKLNCLAPVNEDNIHLSRLTQKALFSGTKSYSNHEILEILTKFDLNTETSEYLKANEFEYSLGFSMGTDSIESLGSILSLMQEIYFSPLLSNEGIEQARQSLLTEYASDEEQLIIKAITAEQVRTYYKASYNPTMTQLIATNIQNPQEVLERCTELFGDAKEISIPLEKSKEDEILIFTDSLEYHSQSKAYVIDGKIWMDVPDWKNTHSTGKKVGVACLVGGAAILGLCFFAFPLSPVVLGTGVFLGFFNTVAGAYFLISPYYKDPQYVEKARIEDLSKGYAHSYTKGRAGITLTPFERRVLFIQEMVYSPLCLYRLPILLLADSYQMNDPVFSDMFTPQEFVVLNNLKRNFITERNEYAFLRANLENELSILVAPFATIRDCALREAEELYNQNYYVKIQRNAKAEMENDIQGIEYDYRLGYITFYDQEERIEDAKESYNRKLSEIEDDLATASSELKRNQRLIEIAFDAEVEICKRIINYNGRMALYESGEYVLIQHYDELLHNTLATFPIEMPSLPDHLDLRG